MASLADYLGTKSHSAMAAVPQDIKELEEAVAGLSVQPKRQPKKKGGKPSKQGGKLCYKHEKYRDQACKCADSGRCMWS